VLISNISEQTSYPRIVFCLARNFDNSPVLFLTRPLVCSAYPYPLSLGEPIESELLVVNFNNYYKSNLNYLTSINKESRRLILFIIH
jgi:hypothetical protein